MAFDMRERYCKGFRRASSLLTTMHTLSEPIFWIAATLCVIAELAILRAAFIPRSHASETGPIPNSPRGAEMMWAIIPAIGLAFLLAATWRAIH